MNWSDHHSLSVGPNGPLLLQDHYSNQKMAHLRRKRVPERVVHSKGGGGAHGFLHITEDVSQFTKAKLFLRFSTVAQGLG
ncbi:catalase [Nonomuraea sp. PA05]|uniref:catalase n=1 Tax=Nonomuraea sp. PA05 TaxID=2604466 RepID=UPI003983D4F7